MKTFHYNSHDGSFHALEDDLQNPGKLIIHHKQDIKPALKWARKQRNNGVNDLGGARDDADIKHYATVPMGATLAMRNEGIDFWNKDHEKDMLKWIEKEGSGCKVTNRKLFR